MADFLKQAIAEGLRSDRFPQPLAKTMLNTSDNFVTKCPICRAVKGGFSTYLATEQKAKSKLKTKDIDSR